MSEVSSSSRKSLDRRARARTVGLAVASAAFEQQQNYEREELSLKQGKEALHARTEIAIAEIVSKR